MLLSLPLLSQPSVSTADDLDCAACHGTQATELAGSIHHALRCYECHGGATKYTLASDVVATYASAEAGRRPSFDHGDSFKGKPDRKGVPTWCGECHADIERMNVYGIRTDQLARYWTSGHGKTLRDKGDDRVAVCTDCHGVHDILKHTEPASRTNPFNVPDTCATCHTDAELMGAYDLPVEVVDEYRHSVHGDLLLNREIGRASCRERV